VFIVTGRVSGSDISIKNDPSKCDYVLEEYKSKQNLLTNDNHDPTEYIKKSNVVI
jgi:hypothetical protein